MIGSFRFNNIESSAFNLVCRSVKRPLLPSVKTKRIDIPGASGVYDFESNEYSMRTVQMSIAYIGTDYEELRSRARLIAQWLCVQNWSKLIIHDEDDKYYLAKVTSEIDLQNLWESGTAEISFDCQPFAYSINEQVLNFPVTGSINYIINNPGTRHINYKSPPGSKFLIRAVGSWAAPLSISMSNKTLHFNQAGSGTLIIDNIKMEVNLNGVNSFSNLSGDIGTFFQLHSGNTTLSITGTNLNLILSIEFIPMWI